MKHFLHYLYYRWNTGQRQEVLRRLAALNGVHSALAAIMFGGMLHGAEREEFVKLLEAHSVDFAWGDAPVPTATPVKGG